MIPNTLVLPAYACVGWAFTLMLRRQRADQDDPARVDALLVGLGAAFLVRTTKKGSPRASAREVSVRDATADAPQVRP